MTFDYNKVTDTRVIATLDNDILSPGNKVGNLKKDDHGYVKVYLSAWDVPTRAGAVYEATDELVRLHAPDSRLGVLAKNGQLRGEIEHPWPEPNQTFPQYLNRVRYIDNRFVSFQIKNPHLCEIKDEFGHKMLVTEAWVIGSGAYMDQFDRRLENPDENLDFSVRSVCHPSQMVGGVLHKFPKFLATWDQVNRGGMPIANKYDSPSFESDDDKVDLADWFDQEHPTMNIDMAAVVALQQLEAQRKCFAFEDDNALFDSRMFKDPNGDWKKLEVLKRTSLGWSPLK